MKPDCYRDYWKEAVESSLDEAGVTATLEQLEAIAGDMKVSHEQVGMAFGHDVASQNYQAEKDRTIADLRKELADERAKQTCAACRGQGTITICGPSHSATSDCSACRGQGRR